MEKPINAFDADAFIGGAGAAPAAPAAAPRKPPKPRRRKPAPPGKTRARIELADALYERLEAAAREEKRPVQELVAKALERQLGAKRPNKDRNSIIEWS